MLPLALYPLLGAILLLTPTSALISGKAVHQTHGSHLSPNPSLSRLFFAWPNWLDFARGLGGAWGVLLLGQSLPPENAAADPASAFLIQSALLLIAASAQTICFRNRKLFLAPVFFLAGIGFAVSHPFAVAAGFTMGLVAAGSVQRLRLLLPVAAVTHLVIAFGLQGLSLEALLASALIFWPVLLGLMTKKELWFVVRKAPPFGL